MLQKIIPGLWIDPTEIIYTFFDKTSNTYYVLFKNKERLAFDDEDAFDLIEKLLEHCFINAG